MNIKSFALFFLALILLVPAAGCSNGEHPFEITEAGQLADDSLTPDERILYLPEVDCLIPYYILSADYNDSTLLLRRDILDVDYPFSREDNGYYAESPIDSFLNSDFLNLFSEPLLGIIQDTPIDICCKFPDTDHTEQITRKIFLLSASEVNIHMNIVQDEGKPVDFFKNPENHLAFRDEQPAGWWLRSTYIMDRGLAWHIQPDGTVHGSAVQFPSGVRPALCIPSSSPVTKNECGNGYILADDSNPVTGI